MSCYLPELCRILRHCAFHLRASFLDRECHGSGLSSNHCCPTGLMARSKACTIVAAKVFVERIDNPSNNDHSRISGCLHKPTVYLFRRGQKRRWRRSETLNRARIIGFVQTRLLLLIPAADSPWGFMDWARPLVREAAEIRAAVVVGKR